MCRWRRTLDFDFWDLGRVSHLEEENNGSQLAGACKASRSYLRVWNQCEQHFRNSQKLWVHPDVNTATQTVTDHHVSLTQPDWIFAKGCTDCFCAHIYMRLDLKTNLKTFVGVEAVNPREIHPHTEGTNTCTSRSVSRFDMFVFCFASDELPVSQTSLTCRSFLFLVPLEWILINKDGFPNKLRGETFYIEQLVKVSAAPLPWSEPSVQKVIMFIVC